MSLILLNSTATTTQQAWSLDRLFGEMLNVIFNAIYSVSPVYSLGFTIILFTIIVKLLLYPLAKKQYVTTKQMQIVQPELKAIQDSYKDKKDPESQQKMMQEIQSVHAKHGTSMFGGCLPALIQLPILLALFNVLRDAHIHISKLADIYAKISTQVTSVPNYKTIFEPLIKTKSLQIKNIDTPNNFNTLISNLTSTDWTNLLVQLPVNVTENLNTLIASKDNLVSFFTIDLTNVPTYGNISVLIPIITAFTTYTSIKYSSSTNKKDPKQPVDPNDSMAQMEKSMSMMTYMIPGMIFLSAFNFPAGLGLYWLLGNLITIAQQFYLTKFVNVTTKAGVSK